MISDLDVRIAQVPLHRPFAHATHSHSRTRSVLLHLRWDGVQGWGEGAPRPYVTGETLVSAHTALTGLDTAVLDVLLSGLDFGPAVAVLADLDLPRLLGGLRRAPAAAAALETALLDALCRRHGLPMEAVIDACPGVDGALAERRVPPRPVSQVVDLSRSPAEQFGALGASARSHLAHVKLKALGDPEETARRAVEVRRTLGDEVGLSVDANGAWDPQDALKGAGLLRDQARPDWLEEPTTPRDWATMRRIQELGVPVMLDESAVDPVDVDLAAAAGAASLVNVRVSKCGGLLPALRTAARAADHGMRVQLGVQVGEVGPLWSVGRTLAARLYDPVTVEAGRQDEWFPTPLTEPAFAIDRDRGLAPPVAGHGHGLAPSAALTPYLRTSPERTEDL
ncbi:enolase C-terminal domain-like protein [Streptomyces sp. NPDC088194]|uniref:enolase C-terminal domain-like protein n=1 Tax=Streptomyces sp. NPDC088194 TaxID=3154931 RepID=UPI00344D0B8A